MFKVPVYGKYINLKQEQREALRQYYLMPQNDKDKLEKESYLKTVLNCDSETLGMLQKCFLEPVLIMPHNWLRYHNLSQYSKELINKAVADGFIIRHCDWFFLNPGIYNRYNKTPNPDLTKLETIND